MLVRVQYALLSANEIIPSVPSALAHVVPQCSAAEPPRGLRSRHNSDSDRHGTQRFKRPLHVVGVRSAIFCCRSSSQIWNAEKVDDSSCTEVRWHQGFAELITVEKNRCIPMIDPADAVAAI